MTHLDTDALYVAIDRKRRAGRLYWRQVAAQADIGMGFPSFAITAR